MPRFGKIVRQYSRHHAFAFDLYAACLRIERASDRTIIGEPAALEGLTRAATASANQGAQKKRGNVNPFHRRYVSRKYECVRREWLDAATTYLCGRTEAQGMVLSSPTSSEWKRGSECSASKRGSTRTKVKPTACSRSAIANQRKALSASPSRLKTIAIS